MGPVSKTVHATLRQARPQAPSVLGRWNFPSRRHYNLDFNGLDFEPGHELCQH